MISYQRGYGSGFSLPALLLFVPLLLVMVLALFVSLTQGSQWTGRYQGHVAAEYVAEAGAADALQQLKAQPNWVRGFQNKAMIDGRGTYTITFNQSGSNLKITDSINNFDGEHPDSALGPETVPDGTALLSVAAKVGAYEKRAFFLIGTGDPIIRVKHALLASGRIQLRGRTNIRAVESLAEEGNLSALVQSNQEGHGTDMVSWNGLPNQLDIRGEVRSSSRSATAVNLSGYVPTGGIITSAAQVPVPPAGIVANVYAKRGAQPFTQDLTTVPSGESYRGSDLEVHGDLVLEGDLYVEGNLKVNGSITGNGSVYVTGDSELYGDASINAKNRVALHSQGHVKLNGFDGDRYLDARAAADTSDADGDGQPDFSRWLSEARWATEFIESEASAGRWGVDSDLDLALSVLAPGLTPDDRASQFQTEGHATLGHHDVGATLVRMKERLGTLDPGPTRDFMIKKLENLSELYSANGGVLGQADAKAFEDFQNHGTIRGVVEGANDPGIGGAAATTEELERRRAIALNIVSQVNTDKLGSSYFQGLIYTNGAFIADNQVTVLGAVVVNDDGSQRALSTSSGPVAPGDLLLRNGSNIAYVKDFFFGPQTRPRGPRRILLHLGDG